MPAAPPRSTIAPRSTDALLAALRPVEATINYVARAETPPRVYYVEPPPGAPWSTLRLDRRVTAVHDVRGAEDLFSLEEHGMCFPTRPLDFEAFDDDGAVQVHLYPLFENWARELLGVDDVKAYNHAIRRRDYGMGGERRGSGTRRRIADFAHNDYLADTACDRARQASPGWSGSDFCLVNFWFPLRGPLYDHPLALCGNRSAAEGDYQPIENVFDSVSELMPGLGHAPGHQWFYRSAMATDEFLVFVTWDSRGGIDRAIPHVAFEDPSAPEDAPPRESFELRVAAFRDGGRKDRDDG